MQYNNLVPLIEDALEKAELKDVEWATRYWYQRKTVRRFIEAALDCGPEEAACREVLSRHRVPGNNILTLEQAIQKPLAMAATGGPKTLAGAPDPHHGTDECYERAVVDGQGIAGLGESRQQTAKFISGQTDFPPTPIHKLKTFFPGYGADLQSDWEEAVSYVAIKREVTIETVQATAYLVLDK